MSKAELLPVDRLLLPGRSTMKPSIALERNIEAIRHLAAENHTANPRVFGSAIKGGDADSSDLDLLVDPLPGVTLFDLGGLHSRLRRVRMRSWKRLSGW